MNIVLIGYRCSGKTRVGRILAWDLKRHFLDTDHLIEVKTGMPIDSYVTRYGWNDFRNVERTVIDESASNDNVVIATGGGAVMDHMNVQKLRRNGWVVWLDAGAAAIRERMARAQQQGDIRPQLSENDPLEEVDTMLRERRAAYEQASDWALRTDTRSPQEVERAIMRALPHELRGNPVRTA